MSDSQQQRESRPLPKDSDWLSPFLGQLGNLGSKLLEVGCGPGIDAATLLAAGFEVTAFDRITLDRARAAAPRAALLRADLSRSLPFCDGAFDAAMSSLALHYLPWRQTRETFGEVHRVLRRGAAFLFRVNATDDFAHGAGQGEEIEQHFFRDPHHFHADTKRFFDEEMVKAAVDGWFDIEHLEHKTIYRYRDPKRVWECLALAT